MRNRIYNVLVNIAVEMLHFILKVTFIHFPLHCMINLFNFHRVRYTVLFFLIESDFVFGLVYLNILI